MRAESAIAAGDTCAVSPDGHPATKTNQNEIKSRLKHIANLLQSHDKGSTIMWYGRYAAILSK